MPSASTPRRQGRRNDAATLRWASKRSGDLHGWLSAAEVPVFVGDIQRGLAYGKTAGRGGASDAVSWKPTVIDLFCGAGGFTQGFVTAGFQPVWANDFDESCVATYRENFGSHAVAGDIEEILRHREDFPIPKADAVIGGPPCQGFSLLNKKRAGDRRRNLWKAYWSVVEETDPLVFVMENVPELLGSPEFDSFVRRAEALGFQVLPSVLVAADFGVPQRRRRAIVIGTRVGRPTLPTPTHAAPEEASPRGLLRWSTVRDAIVGLPPPVGTEPRPDLPPPLDLHFGRTPTAKSLARYRAVPEGGNRFDLQRIRPDITPTCWKRKKSGGTDLFGRLWWDRPSVTIRTEFFKPEKGRYLHPSEDRPITHREAARIQSFPDTFKFAGSKIEIARQIGNAVPCLMAAAIAAHVRTHLETHLLRRAC